MPQPTVLVAGSLHYDIMVQTDHLPQRDETAVGHRWFPKFGGKGGNQAVACARAGIPVRMLGAVGDDDFASFIQTHLAAAGVDQRFVTTLPGTGSGMSVAIQDAAGDYAATIVSGANLAIDENLLQDDALWQDVALLILQNEVPLALNLAAATAARVRGVRTLLNAAPARPLDAALTPLIDILVVNAVEAEMMGTPSVTTLPTAAAAAAHLAKRIPTVIVTAGATGLALHSHQGTFTLPAERVTVISTHGAGDAFIGTLAAHLMRGDPLPAACQAASTAAALHVSTAR